MMQMQLEPSSKTLYNRVQEEPMTYSQFCKADVVYLFVVGKEPLSCMSNEGSEKSSSNISRAAVVLNEASSCWADVPI